MVSTHYICGVLNEDTILTTSPLLYLWLKTKPWLNTELPLTVLWFHTVLNNWSGRGEQAPLATAMCQVTEQLYQQMLNHSKSGQVI